MVTVGMSPRLPSTHSTEPLAVMLTPLARSPSCIGALVNCASQPTLSLSIWQRVWPDLVSMNTWPLWSGGGGRAPAGGLALGGAGRDGAGEGIDGLVFGNDGSAGPAPGVATGFPWMRELHPPTSAALSSRPASSSRPPAIVVLTLRGNIAKPAYARGNASDCSDAPTPPALHASFVSGSVLRAVSACAAGPNMVCLIAPSVPASLPLSGRRTSTAA